MPVSLENKRLAKNSIYMTIRMIFVLIISLYTTRIVLKALGIVDYGVYNVVCGFVAMFAFLTTSISNGIQRFFNYEFGKNGPQGATVVFRTALLIQFLLSIIIVILAETLGLWYINTQMVIPENSFNSAQWIYQFSIISLIISIIQAPLIAAVTAHEKMNFYALMSVFDAIFKLGIAIIIYYFFINKLFIYGFLMMIIGIINFVGYFIYCKIYFTEIKFSFQIDKTFFRSMLSFSGWNMFGSFASVIKEQGINLVLNYFFGPVVNAARGIAIQINGGLMSLVQNITVPARPQVIQSYASGNIRRTIDLTIAVSKFSCFILYIFALPIIYEINFILQIWLGKEVPPYTNIFAIIIILISFFNNLNSSISGVVHATGKMKLYQLSTSFTVLISIPLSFIALKIYPNPTIALWIVFVSMIVTQIVSVFVAKKLIGLSPILYFKEVIYPFLIVVISTSWIPFIIVSYIDDGWLRCISICVISFIAIIFSAYKLGLNNRERHMATEIISKILLRFTK